MAAQNAVLATFLTLTAVALATATGAHSTGADTAVARGGGQHDPHAQHRRMMAGDGRYQVSRHAYELPELTLVDAAGDRVAVREIFRGDRPIILSFIFTSCTTICPVLTATLAQAEDRLMEEPIRPRIVSVSIDPEFDTPETLRRYAEDYHAGQEWTFLTGDQRSIVALQRAFDAYRGDKMNHRPAAYLRAAGDPTWVRLDGFTTAADLLQEYRRLIVDRNAALNR